MLSDIPLSLGRQRHWPAILLCTAAFAAYLAIVVLKYLHFAYSDWDQAAGSQMLWLMGHGNFHCSVYGINFLGDHAELIDLLIAPLAVLTAHPLTLPVIQVLSFAFSGWLLYWLSLERLEERSALVLVFMYFVSAPNLLAMCNDAKTETLSGMLFLLTVMYYRRKALTGFYTSAGLLLLVKESMPLVVAMFGLWAVVNRDRDSLRWGLLPILAASAYFLLAVGWLIPHAAGTSVHPFWAGRYGHLGRGPVEVFQSLFHWQTWRHALIDPANVNFIVSLFGIFLVPALLSPGMLLPIVPVIGYHLLSSALPEKSIFYYYSLTMTPAIFLAVAHSVGKVPNGWIRHGVMAILLLGCLLSLGHYQSKIIHRIGWDRREGSSHSWSMIHRIPDSASVIATFEFLPALSLRTGLYSFHKVYDSSYQATKERFIVPCDVRYALVDFDDENLRSQMIGSALALSKVTEFLQEWEEIDSYGSVKLYRRKG